MHPAILLGCRDVIVRLTACYINNRSARNIIRLSRVLCKMARGQCWVFEETVRDMASMNTHLLADSEICMS